MRKDVFISADEFLDTFIDGSSEQNEVYNYVDILTNFSACLVEYRIRHELTQKQLAEQLEISQPMVSRYEQGTKNISVETLNHICYALGISLEIKMKLGEIAYKSAEISSEIASPIQRCDTSAFAQLNTMHAAIRAQNEEWAWPAA